MPALLMGLARNKCLTHFRHSPTAALGGSVRKVGRRVSLGKEVVYFVLWVLR